MSVGRGPRLTHQVLHEGLAALCGLSLATCSDGYPTADVPHMDLARMSQADLLTALNAMGTEPHVGKRWRYSLHADCELSVRDGDTDGARVAFEGADVSVRSVDGVSEIRLVPETGGETKSVTALETRRWSDTVRARSLLTHLQAGCGNPVVSP
jgi:hypothetical protein